MKQEINYRQLYLQEKIAGFVLSDYDFWDSYKIYKNQILCDFTYKYTKLYDFYESMSKVGYDELEIRERLIEILREKQDDDLPENE